VTALEGPLTSTVTIEIMDAKQARECPTSAAFDRSVWRVVGAPGTDTALLSLAEAVAGPDSPEGPDGPGERS
jgi:hypothetical protein